MREIHPQVLISQRPNDKTPPAIAAADAQDVDIDMEAMMTEIQAEVEQNDEQNTADMQNAIAASLKDADSGLE